LRNVGWSAFCDWLDNCYRHFEHTKTWPPGLPRPDPTVIRSHIFQHLQ
jgi:hypothetical protein